MKEKTILERLHHNCVFSVEKMDNGRFIFIEQGDEWFADILTKEEVQQLIAELQELIK